MRARVLVLIILLGVGVTACGDDGARRVLLVGDSVMSQAAPAVAFELPDDDVRNTSVSGSGLLTPDFVDWPDELRRLLERYDPDVVVFLFVGNYEVGDSQGFTTADGHHIPDREDPTFLRAWQAQAQRMTDATEEAGADAVWVLPPPMQDRQDQAVVDGLREAYEDLGTSTIDADDALAGDDGAYVANLRNPDGVHLNRDGAQALGRLIADET